MRPGARTRSSREVCQSRARRRKVGFPYLSIVAIGGHGASELQLAQPTRPSACAGSPLSAQMGGARGVVKGKKSAAGQWSSSVRIGGERASSDWIGRLDFSRYHVVRVVHALEITCR